MKMSSRKALSGRSGTKSVFRIGVFMVAVAMPGYVQAKAPPAGKSAQLLCDKKTKVYSFVVDATGNVSDSGRSIEGPACVQVYFPAAQYKASLSQVTTTSKGPDASQTLLGTASTSGGGLEKLSSQAAAPSTLQDAFNKLVEAEDDLRNRLIGIKNRYTTASNDQDDAITSIRKMLQSEMGTDPAQMQMAVKNGFKTVNPIMKKALGDEGAFVPSDRADATGVAVLPALQQLATHLTLLKVKFVDGIKWDDANPKKCRSDESGPADTKSIAFGDWLVHCKDAYDGLTLQVNSDIQDAQSYTSQSDKVVQLRSKLAIVKYWRLHFQGIGMLGTMTDDDIDAADISGAFSTAVPVRCNTLFNMNSSTAVSVVTIDQAPTLDGGNPTVKTQPAFLTVTCGSPISISAGIALSSIEQKEFAIIKSAGGANNTSINKFGTISDSRLHPMPMGMVHVRLADWGNHKYAFHGSFGVAGNLKGQDSGGSTAEFLPGVSFSFWRSMYLSCGPHIGTKAELVGGFKEGDLVPSDITSIQGLVKRSYTVGFGFAITFTKP